VGSGFLFRLNQSRFRHCDWDAIQIIFYKVQLLN
jgi:hypothetical protein